MATHHLVDNQHQCRLGRCALFSGSVGFHPPVCPLLYIMVASRLKKKKTLQWFSAVLTPRLLDLQRYLQHCLCHAFPPCFFRELVRCTTTGDRAGKSLFGCSSPSPLSSSSPGPHDGAFTFTKNPSFIFTCGT